MSGSDCIVVNSNFTRRVVSKLFPGIGDLGVIYPCVDITASQTYGTSTEERALWGGMKVLLSINRFERKKDVGLAIRAFHGLSEEERRGCRLVIAGQMFFNSSLVYSLISDRWVRSASCRKRAVPQRARNPCRFP